MEDKKLTVKEIISRLKELDITPFDFATEDFDVDDFIKEFGEYETVDSEGGYEGGGEEYYRVKYFKTHGVYIQTDGWYYSYDGVNVDDYGYEVFPKDVVRTIYLTKEALENYGK